MNMILIPSASFVISFLSRNTVYPIRYHTLSRQFGLQGCYHQLLLDPSIDTTNLWNREYFNAGV